jgi:hypothetical protein
VSQSVELAIVVYGMAELLQAVVESGFSHEDQKEFRTEDGLTHAVDLVVKDGKGVRVGVKVDERTGQATFVGHDGRDQRATALVHRIAQRYAYSKTLEELKRKGYQVAREEKQKDGTIKLIAQRWR